MESAAAFGKILPQLRQEAALSQEALGFEADLRRTYVNILELGQQQPSLTAILKLAKALNLTGSTLVGMFESELAAPKRKR